MVKIFKNFWDWLFHRPLALKEGKFYQSREGRIYGPLKMCPDRVSSNSPFYFKDEAAGLTWSFDGKYLNNYRSKYDLIKEITFTPEKGHERAVYPIC